MNVKFEQPEAISKDEAQKALSSVRTDVVATTLIRIALWEQDWRWAEKVFLNSLRDDRKEVRSAALLSLGHLARLHHILHTGVVLPAVTALLTDPDCAGLARDAIDDIERYARNRSLPATPNDAS